MFKSYFIPSIDLEREVLASPSSDFYSQHAESHLCSSRNTGGFQTFQLDYFIERYVLTTFLEVNP